MDPVQSRAGESAPGGDDCAKVVSKLPWEVPTMTAVSIAQATALSTGKTGDGTTQSS